MTSRGSQVANPISGNSCPVAEVVALPFAGFGLCGESRQQRSLSHDSIRLSLHSNCKFDTGLLAIMVCANRFQQKVEGFFFGR
jgi:hypothetical protein